MPHEKPLTSLTRRQAMTGTQTTNQRQNCCFHRSETKSFATPTTVQGITQIFNTATMSDYGAELLKRQLTGTFVVTLACLAEVSGPVCGGTVLQSWCDEKRMHPFSAAMSIEGILSIDDCRLISLWPAFLSIVTPCLAALSHDRFSMFQ